MAQSIEEIQEERRNWHWRNSMRPVRFLNLDARAAMPFFLLIFYLRPVTLVITLISTFTFMQLERRGLTFPAAMRALRSWVVGKNRPAWLSMRRRKMRDYG